MVMGIRGNCNGGGEENDDGFHANDKDGICREGEIKLYMNFTAVPSSIDWTEKGACGGWTASAVDAVEGITKIKTGKLFTLSVQERVDCNSSGIPGCDGGSTYEAFEFIKHGLTTKANYHSGRNGTCNTKKEAQPVAKITGYEDVPANSEEALMMAVANQPVAVTVDASGSDFQF
ncbi:hypothetical protein Vadar_015544 [Vaccinium darrowii]|uniref:Uncharacterized protein n=1 Tax=Vaccinium darrowii TaxID=229202 RepID=A0ACB7X9Z3_9ERIC|nr:hypothetical protein Vadar_015544 [Vaccinium darrowii]